MTRNKSPDKLAYICKKCGQSKGRDWHAAHRDTANASRRERGKAQRRREGARDMPPKFKDGLQYCGTCQQYLPPTPEYFYKDLTTANGLTPNCKSCLKKRALEWGQNNKPHAVERAAQWRHEHPAEYKVLSKISKARRRNAGQMPNKQEIQELYAQSDDHCSYCGIRLFGEYHLEHMLPITRGGLNDIENLAIACADCNLSKGDKTFNEWAAVRGW
jgi:5-methylcytosine-specific restriction endonuclease McrA